MSERVRLLDHEAADVHRLVQDYALDGGDGLRDGIREILEDFAGDSHHGGDASIRSTLGEILALIVLERPVRTPAAADLVNAIGEIYETALARRMVDHPQPFSFPLPPPRGAAG